MVSPTKGLSHIYIKHFFVILKIPQNKFSSTGPSCENFIHLQVEPSVFHNEALMTVSHAPARNRKPSISDQDCNFPFGEVSLQIISVNVPIIKGGIVYLEGAHHDVRLD